MTFQALHRPVRLTLLASLSALALTAALGAATDSSAQQLGSRHGLTAVIGSPQGSAVTERLDVRRTNASPSPLPTRSLRVLWTRQTAPQRHAPLVMDDDVVVAVGYQGDAVFLNADGSDRAQVSMGPGPTSAPTLLANGTVVVLGVTGDVVGVRRGSVAFRAHVFEPRSGGASADSGARGTVRVSSMSGRARRSGPWRPPPVAPGELDSGTPSRAWVLPLEDGGLVVALDRELACLDATGAVRTRATAPVAVGSPLLATSRAVVFVTDGGEAYEWDLRGESDSIRSRGSFGGALQGAVAVVDDRHLLGVVDASRLVSLDLRTGEAEPLVTTARGAFTGALALAGPHSAALLEEMTPYGTRILAVDPDGHAMPYATALTPRGASLVADGGLATPLTPTHTALFADPTAHVAYATVDGHVGVASPTGKAELGTLPCGSPPQPPPGAQAQRTRVSAGFAGLVPAGPRSFVIACESGRIARVTGDLD